MYREMDIRKAVFAIFVGERLLNMEIALLMFG